MTNPVPPAVTAMPTATTTDSANPHRRENDQVTVSATGRGQPHAGRPGCEPPYDPLYSDEPGGRSRPRPGRRSGRRARALLGPRYGVLADRDRLVAAAEVLRAPPG